jgi:hypothetical protein
MPRHATATSSRPGQCGNPFGRRPGTQNKRTIEVREICTRLVDDPEYRSALRQRMINGTAGAMEVLSWHYAKGKPIDRVETGLPGEFSSLPNDQLVDRLRAALVSLSRS